MDSKAWDERYTGTELVWSAEPNRFVAEHTGDLPAGRAIDLAAGEGRNAIWLAKQGWAVTAVDFSAAALAKGKLLADAQGVTVDWVAADLLTWRPETGAYDLVVIAYLHLPEADMKAVLAEAAAALAPGGRLVFVGHDRTNLTDGVGGPQDPAILHTPETVAGTLPGLRVERAERAHRPLTVDGEPREAIDTLVIATRD
ncbi:class I SAM-dependent methyltransferase [Yinghuangia seranimata]|uniref:class I SAM-dependent methyltransferase n=1 Tax=Yinghuangia seranimata TaxID=408067 RepID=UPI00248B2952|nr:class I SAM-dependent methyltransferase [Yinghuangia seranimata]MDI2130205.1 class I SAM-dependent methyltransferase [Yinghuangia seranimata]